PLVGRPWINLLSSTGVTILRGTSSESTLATGPAGAGPSIQPRHLRRRQARGFVFASRPHTSALHRPGRFRRVTARPGDSLATWRREYGASGLHRDDLFADPIAAFQAWLTAADATGMHEPNAMVLCTAGPEGPGGRLVLLKGLDERGFVFYTNYGSRKVA